MKNLGFTLIELLVTILIAGTIVAVVVSAILNYNNGTNSYSMGINGAVEGRCISGYKFAIGSKGHPTQVLDQFGKGVPCN